MRLMLKTVNDTIGRLLRCKQTCGDMLRWSTQALPVKYTKSLERLDANWPKPYTLPNQSQPYEPVALSSLIKTSIGNVKKLNGIFCHPHAGKPSKDKSTASPAQPKAHGRGKSSHEVCRHYPIAIARASRSVVQRIAAACCLAVCLHVYSRHPSPTYVARSLHVRRRTSVT